MKIAIRYYGKGKNTETIAKTIGKEINIPVQTINKELKEEVDILFLGTGVYGFTIDEEVKKFIKNLDNVKKVAIFSTSAFSLFEKTVYKRITKLLDKKGINYYKEFYYTKGEYSNKNIGKPDKEDLTRAKEFANKIVRGEINEKF